MQAGETSADTQKYGQMNYLKFVMKETEKSRHRMYPIYKYQRMKDETHINKTTTLQSCSYKIKQDN